jgi:protein-disulfide isomerase
VAYRTSMGILSLEVSSRDHMRGLNLGSVTLVEYGDYQCPYSRQAYPVIESILKQMNNLMRFVYRHFPLTQIHPYAEPAAEAAEIAGAQGHFWEMHQQLYTQPSLDEMSLRRDASLVGLDPYRFSRELAVHLPAGRVQEDVRSGIQSGVDGTPSFFINGVRYRGSWDFASLFAAIKLQMKRLDL